MPILLICGLGFLALTTAVAAVAEFVVRRRRAERARQLRTGGFERWVESERERARIQVTRLSDRRDRARRVARRLMRIAASIRRALKKGRIKSLAWLSTGALAFTGLWALAVRTEVGIDAASFRGLGYDNRLAMSLALVTTLLFCLLGIVLSDLIGLTHVLPRIGVASTAARVALVGSVLLVLAVAVSQLPRLAEFRSAPIAERVRDAENAQAALALLPPEQRPPLLVEQSHKTLAAEEQKLDTARYVDKRLAVGAALAEAATSWAAAWTLLLLAFLFSALLASAATWRADAADAAIRETNQRFVARVVQRAEELEVDPARVSAVLPDRQDQPRGNRHGGAPEEPGEDPAPVPVEFDSPRPAGQPGEVVTPEAEAVNDAPQTWTAF